MKIKRTESEKKPQPRKKSFSSFYIILILAVIILFFLFFLWQQKKINLLTDTPDLNSRIASEDISASEPPPPNKIINDKPNPGYSSTSIDLTENIQSPTVTSLNAAHSSDSGSVEDLLTGDNNNTPQQDLTTKSSTGEQGAFSEKCSGATKVIKSFYDHLDKQEYMKSYGLTQSSEDHFTLLIQRLLDNPPVVTGETDDLFTILQNTAHFFRVIGKDNILILKGILDREKNQFENVLYNFYTIFQTPSCPANGFNLTVSETSLYDYAGFFLNTMGGRLYLFRRDSMSRMVVSYYSILLIDQANKEARNLHGIEIKTAIDQLIAELEASSKQLKFEQLYLDNLYSLKELYQ